MINRLIVDLDPGVHAAAPVREAAADAGGQFHAVRTAAELIAAVRERAPAAVMLPASCAGREGAELCAHVKAESSGRTLVLQSVPPSDPPRPAPSVETGADLYVREPHNRIELAAAFRLALRLADLAATQAMQAERAFLRKTIDSLAGMVMVRDRDGRYVLANESAARFHGATVDALEGTIESSPNAEQILEQDRQVFLTGKPTVAELELMAADGHAHSVMSTRTPLFDDNGVCDRVLETGLDISWRKRAERSMRGQTELLTAIIDNIPVLVVMWDPEMQSFRFNKHCREVLGWTEEDTARGDFMALVYPDPRYRDEVVTYMQSLQPGWRDIKTTAKDGTEIDISWANVPLSDGASIGIGIDVRDRKRAERALREADRRKDEFIAVLSHELRNPLAPIRYAVPLLAGEPLSDAGQRAVAVIDRQVTHLTRLVDDLLDVSRITRGKIELRREQVALASVVNAAVEAASPAIVGARHKLEVVLPDEPIWLYADPARITQIVTNLLNNSAKYTPRGGEITLVAGNDDGHAVVRVRDNGIGIPTESLATVFEMFRQVDSDTADAAHPVPDSAHGGLGIGLALARQLIEMHGGTIEAHSHGVGHGAEFIMRLPIVESEVERSREAAHDVQASAGRLRVLVVDDNVDLVDMLALIIEGAGHDVRKALDGRSAISAAVAYRPHVVLLDLGLPVLSGIEVARELRRRPETAKATLIAMTGWGQAEDRRRTNEAGFDDHLTKPADADTLQKLLARAARSLAS